MEHRGEALANGIAGPMPVRAWTQASRATTAGRHLAPGQSEPYVQPTATVVRVRVASREDPIPRTREYARTRATARGLLAIRDRRCTPVGGALPSGSSRDATLTARSAPSGLAAKNAEGAADFRSPFVRGGKATRHIRTVLTVYSGQFAESMPGCGWGGSNSHELAPNTVRMCRVYRFRHTRPVVWHLVVLVAATRSHNVPCRWRRECVALVDGMTVHLSARW